MRNEELEPFYSEILSWDIKNLIGGELSEIPTNFVSEQAYSKVCHSHLPSDLQSFLPFLFEEIKAQTEQQVAELKFNSKSVYSLNSVTTKTNCSCKFKRKDGPSFKYLDIVVLRRQGLYSSRPSVNQPGDPEPKLVTGMVVDIGNYLEILVSSNHSEALEILTTWQIASIGSVITSTRQYLALKLFEGAKGQFPLRPYLLRPSEVKPKTTNEPHLSRGFVQYMNDHLNPSQFEAMELALSLKEGFALIQGPPGTGKTQTSLRILNALHLQHKMAYYETFTREENYTGTKKDLPPVSAPPPAPIAKPGDADWDPLDDILAGMEKLNIERANDQREVKAQPVPVQWRPKTSMVPLRMLVCAPSNTAVDEILGRVVNSGFVDNRSQVYWPSVLRVGNADKAEKTDGNQNKVSTTVAWLHTFVDKYLAPDKVVSAKLNELEGEKRKVASKMKGLLLTLAEKKFTPDYGAQFGKLERTQISLNKKIQRYSWVLETRKIVSSYPRDEKYAKKIQWLQDDLERRIASSIVGDTDIVFSTLSGTGLKSLAGSKFEIIFIDEAAQSVELETLVALQHMSKSCILVGDPQQLPATVISEQAKLANYQCSLFQRLQAHYPVVLLDTQYRMHPDISLFPSDHFYASQVKNGANTLALSSHVYGHHSGWFGPFRFFFLGHGREDMPQNQRRQQDQELSGESSDTQTEEEEEQAQERGVSSNSYQNMAETAFVLELYQFLSSQEGEQHSVGIITPYKQQVWLLRRQFEKFPEVEINTVDGFQGREKDIIIFSCVRTSSRGIGFLADTRRLNVAITRPRLCLWMVGHAERLECHPSWRALVAHAKKNNAYINVTHESKAKAFSEKVKEAEEHEWKEVGDDLSEIFNKLSVNSKK